MRTFAPVMAGIGNMDYSVFAKWNVIGSIAWVGIFTSAGLFLSKIFPESEKMLTYITFGIILVSLVPGVYHVVKERIKKK